MADFCIICAAPRSGTTFLGDSVRRAYEAAWPGEIFYEVRLEPGIDPRNVEDRHARGNFFTLRARALHQRPELTYPDIDARRALFDLYLDSLRTGFPERRFLLDVKYTSWHHLDGYWRGPKDPPGLIELVREKNIPVVHLVRQNVFALYCSQRLAETSGKWERQAGTPANTGTLTIHPEECHQWMIDMVNTQKMFTKWLAGCTVHALTYENLLDRGSFAHEVAETFTAIFGSQPIRPWTTSFAKVLPPLNRVIENGQTVADYFQGTEFESFVKSSLDSNGASETTI